MIESIYDRINDYGSVKIGLASPNDIRSWSFGEVRKPETINYRTYRAEKDGLFCERLFGPERDWECSCGKYKGTKFKGIICDRCGVKVTHSRVRRKRMGHINLAAPVVHIWFFKAMPSRLANLLDMKTSDIEKITYYQDYVVIDPGDTPLKKNDLLTEEENRRAREAYGGTFKTEMGAEAIRSLLMDLDLDLVNQQLREALAKTSSQQKIKDITKRLKIVESLRKSGNKPEWTVMDVIPVIPPDLRPLVLLESGNFATSDLNDLYRRIINRNNRLKKLVDLNAPEVIIRNEKRMLQQAVDALFDNGRCRRPVLGSSNRPLKSLADMIKGKQGRFRENLLGKRVDYSARSVIVVGPTLKLHQCGLPKKIALELYQPFIIRRLKERGLADTIKSAKKMLERKEEFVWDILEDVIHEHPVLLNRAPTLHRMGIQAFEPILIEGNAIKIHPLVCKGFNADFDGDQMAVHLPLSVEAQAEAHLLMMSTHNIFSPQNGSPIMSPSQDIVLGNYYITLVRPQEKGEGMCFGSPFEAMLAYELGRITIHAAVKVRLTKDKRSIDKDRKYGQYGDVIETSPGRCIFNEILDLKMPFYNYPMGNKALSQVISDCFEFTGRKETIDLLDNIKQLGFKYATLGGLSICITDMRIPSKKQAIIDKTQLRVDRIVQNYKSGALTEGERYNQIIDAWTHARVEVTNEMMREMEEDERDGKPYLNPIFLMTDSGARGSIDQIQQLAGMRALMAKPSGEIIETPIKANFREGLNVLEYFSSTHGARKGLADTALKTADSGYLTRKLADVCQNVIINIYNCGTLQGINKSAVYKGEKISVPLRENIIGRVARDTIRNPITDEVIVGENQFISADIAQKIEDFGIDTIRVRSAMTCESPLGICTLCYGLDLSTGVAVEEGMAVGIIAAQSIGEPGTQLTMRTFHTGGIAEREVMDNQIRASSAGTVKYLDLNAVDVTYKDGSSNKIALKRNGEMCVVDAKGRELERHRAPYGAIILVEDGKKVKASDALFEWDPHRVPILSEAEGIIRFQDIEEGETVRTEVEPGKIQSPVIIEHKGEKHPRIIIESSGKKSAPPITGKDLIERIEARLMIDYPGGKPDSKESDHWLPTRYLLPKWNFKFEGYTFDELETGVAKTKKLISDWDADNENSDYTNHPVFSEMRKKISENSGWIVDPKDKDIDIPKGEGIYFFRDRKTQKVNDGYIGMAGEKHGLRDRLSQHYNGDIVASAFCKHIREHLISKNPESNGTKEDIKGYLKENLEFKFIDLDEFNNRHAEDTDSGRILDFHYLPAKARIQVTEGQEIKLGELLAQQPRAISGTQDITGGLPRITEIFEARKPKEPAAMAEISGKVELRSDKRRGKMTITVRSESAMEVDHHVPHDKHLNVHSGDTVEAGESLTDGPLVPHDILRIRGEEALQQYLLQEIQNVYRAQNVRINDKHVEIVINQMLRKVKVESAGDTDLLPGDMVDKFNFRNANDRFSQSVIITESGDTEITVGDVVAKEELERINETIKAVGGEPAVGGKCQPATATTMLLGITKSALQSESFVSAASFQETTRVLTEAAISGKVDRLLGLKENIILGHLIPAGTAFKPYLSIKVLHLAEPLAPVELESEEYAQRLTEEAKADAAVKEALGLK